MDSNRAIAAWNYKRRTLSALCLAAFAGAWDPARAAECMFEPQGEGRVVTVIDGKTFRLEDGREVRLAGIEPISSEQGAANGADKLAAIVLRRSVTLRGESDSPDRYGRQPAFVFVDQSDVSVQALLLKQGMALVSPSIAEKDCAAGLALAEAAARQAKLGIWSDPEIIKSAGNPSDISKRIGRLTLVEGKVLSVRQAGATTYINFGRRWTRDFAVTISKRAMPAFDAAGIAVKSLENRRIRVRGWVEVHGGPRMEALQTAQIELLDER